MSAGVTPQSVDFLRTASAAQIFQAAGVVAAVGLVVVDANPDKISPDSAGRTVSLINPQAGRLLGIDPATVLGQAIGALPAGPRQSLEAILRVGAGLEQQAAGEAVWREAVALPAGQRLEVSVRWHPDGAAVYSLRRMDGQSAAPNEAEDRLGMMATSLPGLVFQRIRRSDGQLEYPFFSDGVRDALGYAPSEMRVTPDGCLGCLHWADRDEYMARVRMSALDLEPYSETLRAVTRDGQVRWLSGSARPERMENGDILWDCVLIDVTDRMRAEQRLNMIMDHAADGILTFDDDGCIELVNAAVGRIFGYRPQELQGRSVFLLMPDREATRYREALATYLDSGDGWIVSSGAHELEARRQDGTLFPVELTVSEVTTEGHRTFVAVLRDITQRKQTEARLHASEHRLSTIAGNLKGLVFQASADSGAGLAFTYASDGCRDLLGVLPEDLVADPQVFLSLIGAVDQDRYRQALSQSADRLEPLELDLYLQSRSGIGYWVRLWATPRTDGTGAVVWDGVALDVTDRKRIEEELTFLAYYDPLTRLGNRALFHDHFTGARSHADQTRSMAAVVFLGLDRFAMINAACGHDIGDQVLREVAGRLAAWWARAGQCTGPEETSLLSCCPDCRMRMPCPCGCLFCRRLLPCRSLWAGLTLTSPCLWGLPCIRAMVWMPKY